MGLANQEIRDAIDAFGTEQREGRRLPALRERTDAMLGELETLNLMRVPRVPSALRSKLVALVAELPFAYEPRIMPRPSPTTALEVVFEIQEGLFRLMFGAEPEDDRLEVAS
jgi:hypothetical protein